MLSLPSLSLLLIIKLLVKLLLLSNRFRTWTVVSVDVTVAYDVIVADDDIVAEDVTVAEDVIVTFDLVALC